MRGHKLNNMSNFNKYRRTQIAEMREVTEADISNFKEQREFYTFLRDVRFKVSVSEEDLKNGSPKIGDMVARNPKNHNDQWLVAKKYFEDNFESLSGEE